MNNEYTKQQLAALFDAKALDGKNSFDDIAKMVFDAKFPDDISKKAVEELTEHSNKSKRFDELDVILLNKAQEVKGYEEEIEKLTKKRNAVLSEVAPLLEEHEILKIYFQ